MKAALKKEYIKGLLVIALFIGLSATGYASVANATISNPHPTPPANSVTGAMIVDGTITNADIALNASISRVKLYPDCSQYDMFYTFSTTFQCESQLQFNPNTTTLTVTGQLNITGTTTFNGVPYVWPSSQGATSTILENNGSGTIGWANSPVTNYGTGADGSLTITTGTTTLTSDKNYTSLTIDAGAALDTNGYRINVYGTLSNSGIIYNNGGNGGNGGVGGASIPPAVGAGGAGGAGGTLVAGTNGVAGGSVNQSTFNGDPGSAGTSINPALGSNGANGGAGGSGDNGTYTGGAGGGGGVVTLESLYQCIKNNCSLSITKNATTTTNNIFYEYGSVSNGSLSNSASGGGGGGGGYNDNVGSGGTGGGSGGDGGIVYILTNTLNNTGKIEANGGNGGNGGNGVLGTSYDSGGGGGGAGGVGGVVVISYDTLVSIGTVEAIGGIGGLGGTTPSGTDNGSNGGGNKTGGVYINHNN